MERRIGKARPGIGRGQPRQRHRVGNKVGNRIAIHLGGRSRRRRLPDEHAQAKTAFARTLEFFGLPQAHARGQRLAAGKQNLSGGRTFSFRFVQRPLGERSIKHRHGSNQALVPPTVIPSIRIVGRPTPTGTDWPSLPQVPIPESSARSLPTIATRVSTSGPLPISVASLTGRVTWPSASMKVLVIRGIGANAKLSRRPFPVGFIFIRRALRRSCR